MAKKLTKSLHKTIAGVCGGIGEYLDIDPTLVKAVYLILTIFSAAFPGFILYIILALLMPNADSNNQIEK